MQQSPGLNRLLPLAHAEHNRPTQHKEGLIPGMGMGCRSGAVLSRGEKHLEGLGVVTAQQNTDVKTGDALRCRPSARLHYACHGHIAERRGVPA